MQKTNGLFLLLIAVVCLVHFDCSEPVSSRPVNEKLDYLLAIAGPGAVVDSTGTFSITGDTLTISGMRYNPQKMVFHLEKSEDTHYLDPLQPALTMGYHFMFLAQSVNSTGTNTDTIWHITGIAMYYLGLRAAARFPAEVNIYGYLDEVNNTVYLATTGNISDGIDTAIAHCVAQCPRFMLQQLQTFFIIESYDGSCDTTYATYIHPINGPSFKVYCLADSIHNRLIIRSLSHDSLYAIPYFPLPATVHINAPKPLPPDTGTVIDGWRIFDCENRTFPCERPIASEYVQVFAIAFDRSNKAWIGTNAGLARYDDTAWSVFDTSNSDNPANSISALLFDNQDRLWIGTGGKYSGEADGIAVIDNGSWSVFNSENQNLPDDDINCLAQAPDGTVWAGTEGGIVGMTPGNWTFFDTTNSPLPGNRVFAIDFDKQGNLWAGTCPSDWSPEKSLEGGISKYDGARWTVYTTANSSLPSGNVFSLHIDTENIPWAGMMGKGLARLVNDAWQPVIADTLYLLTQMPIAPATFSSEVINDIVADASGNLWFAGSFLYRYNASGWQAFAIPSKKYSLTSGLFCLAFSSDAKIWVGGGEGLYIK